MLCTGLYALIVCVKSPHSLVPRSFGVLTQTTRAYNPVRRTFYAVNYIYDTAKKSHSRKLNQTCLFFFWKMNIWKKQSLFQDLISFGRGVAILKKKDQNLRSKLILGVTTVSFEHRSLTLAKQRKRHVLSREDQLDPKRGTNCSLQNDMHVTVDYSCLPDRRCRRLLAW